MQSATLPVIAAEEEEDELQLTMMTAQAEEELRRGALALPPVTAPGAAAVSVPPGASGSTVGTVAAAGGALSPGAASVAASSSAAAHAPQAYVTEAEREVLASEAWRVFTERLAAFNTCSAGMNTVQYAVYAWARKAGFTGTPKTKLAFASQLTAPALTAASLEVLAYLTFDRLCAVVEAAGKLAASAATAASAGDAGASCDSIPLHAYQAAIAALPPLPSELNAVFKELLEEDACGRQREGAAVRLPKVTPAIATAPCNSTLTPVHTGRLSSNRCCGKACCLARTCATPRW